MAYGQTIGAAALTGPIVPLGSRCGAETTNTMVDDVHNLIAQVTAAPGRIAPPALNHFTETAADNRVIEVAFQSKTAFLAAAAIEMMSIPVTNHRGTTRARGGPVMSTASRKAPARGGIVSANAPSQEACHRFRIAIRTREDIRPGATRTKQRNGEPQLRVGGTRWSRRLSAVAIRRNRIGTDKVLL